MKLTKAAIKAINVTPIRLRLAIELSFTEQWIVKLLILNKDNSPLTLAKALQIIEEETGLKQSEILTEEIETKGRKKNGQRRKITLENRKNTVIQ